MFEMAKTHFLNWSVKHFYLLILSQYNFYNMIYSLQGLVPRIYSIVEDVFFTYIPFDLPVYMYVYIRGNELYPASLGRLN